MAANRRSTVGSLNEVDGPRGLLSYGYNAFSTIYHTAFGLAFAAVMNIIPISMIAVGYLNIDECPAEPFIPQWLIWMGVILLFKYLIDTSVYVYKICFNKQTILSDQHQMGPLDWFSSLVLTVWFILGSYWLFGTFGVVQFEMHGYSDFCDEVTYCSVFVIIMLTYLVLFLLSVCFCVFCAIICWKLKMDRNQYRSPNTENLQISSL